MKYELGKEAARADFIDLAKETAVGFSPRQDATIKEVAAACGDIAQGKEKTVFQKAILLLKGSEDHA